MELLIVVAIIAVLVAIGIPFLSSQLEKSREATDLANIRSAYAEVMINEISDEEALSLTVELKQTQDYWLTESAEPALMSIGKVIGTPTALGTCKVYFSKEDNTAVIEFDGEGSDEPDDQPFTAYDNTLEIGKYRAKTLEQTVKQLLQNGSNLNGLVGDDNSVSAFNMTYLQNGQGGSFMINGERTSFSSYFNELTGFDYSLIDPSLPVQNINANLCFYVTKDGSVPYFSYKEEVVNPDNVHRMIKQTTIYNQDGTVKFQTYDNTDSNYLKAKINGFINGDQG